ncbi:bifunctional glyoxylate/hydroxypyruvate reductase B, partial [Azotobacter chroococcum]|nr:bifunctional glyoxylate/hydroxypyruvate reductase B [Azotobacter chroococcum]
MKNIVLYKKLSAELMTRLRQQAQVTCIDDLSADGLARLRDALPTAHGLLGASLR